MKNFSGIQAFVRVGDMGSFTSAAHELGQTASGVSKAVGLLEAELGVRLFHRTTRALHFTPDGVLFYERCKQALQELHDAKEAMVLASAAPSGRVKLDLPVAFGHSKIVPHLPQLISRYPKLELDVTLSDKFSNLARDGIDVAVRISHLEDSSMFQKKLCEVRTILCASPAYIEKAGMPSSLDEIKEHETVTYLSYQNPTRRIWRFEVEGKDVVIQPGGRLRFNTGDSLLAAVKQGGGIGYLFDFMAEPEFKRGNLVPVLPQCKSRAIPVFALYLPHRQLSPKIRACLDFFAEIM